MSFKEKLEGYANLICDHLAEYVTEKALPEGVIYDAMRYSLMAGGKRLRPVLALGVCDMLGGNQKEVLPFACAIEMIHTYSLIHDDLPAMDNDDFRRGKPTNHKIYGEAMAILAGDALLNLAFEVLLGEIAKADHNQKLKIRAAGEIAKASGINGMVAGQVIDLKYEGKGICADTLKRMHKYKTGALIKTPVISTAILCKSKEASLLKIESFADNLGIAFQIKDDILDVEGSTEKLGKMVGSDAENKKSTYVSLYGLKKSKELLAETTNKAIENLEEFGTKAKFLTELAKYLLNREY
ncbi:MAG: polyprenyl synthetase family protein [Clostridium sp.]|nr:polyprenyl synthetase family protein [Clostridium sp.]